MASSRLIGVGALAAALAGVFGQTAPGSAPAPLAAQAAIDAGQMLKPVSAEYFGVNAAIWDSHFDTPQTAALLEQMQPLALRFPGGSLSDEYHWAKNVTDSNSWTWATSFGKFAAVATNLAAQIFITVNYGSGTAEEAAGWVRQANLVLGCHIRNWEIGNENYGSWETDKNVPAHDPFTYAQRAAQYIAAMKAVDGRIRVGVVAVAGEDSYANNTAHPALNPRTGQTHNGWTPVLLTTLKALGVVPDFLICHRYAQEPGSENDDWLLHSSATWAHDAANLRQQLTDYLGAAGGQAQLVCTENNSVSYNPGKQTTSLVNALFLADSVGQCLQTEFRSLVWWDLRNGEATSNNNSSYLYGWRPYGDYGMIDGPSDPYPTYYAAKLLKYFARPGDAMVRAASDNRWLAAYAARRADGALSLMLINKSPDSIISAQLAITNFIPDPEVISYSYGVPQDDAARTGQGSPDLAQAISLDGSTNFSRSIAPYSVTTLWLQPGAPRLAAALDATGGLQLELNGQPGVSYEIESSADLTVWTPISTNQAAAQAVTVAAPWPITARDQFFRAVWRE